MNDTYEARAGFAVADAIRACADDLRSSPPPIRQLQMAALLSALADMLDQPPNATREDVREDAVLLLRGMCKHD